MARALRLTKAERELLKGLFTGPNELGWNAKVAASILKKLTASEETPAGVDVVPLEEALVRAARGKVLALEAGHAMASRRALQLTMTVEECELVGAWMARQGWMTTPFTIIDVQNKWYQWLPKARATQPPPALAPGLGSHAQDGRGSAAAGKAAAGGRPAPGFGRKAPHPRTDGVPGD